MNSVNYLINNCFTELSLEKQLEIKRLGRPLPDLNIQQNIVTANRHFKRNFKQSLYNSADWICGCDIKHAFYCFPCLLFGGELSWTRTGVTDINHLAKRIRNHDSSAGHIRNSLHLSLLGSTNVFSHFDTAYRRNILEHNEKVRRNRYILNILINCIRYYGAFEVALRGNNQDTGVFKGLVNFSSELDLILKTHLDKASAVFKGNTSKLIQNELLEVMLEVCHDQIKKEIAQADFLSVIVDESSDISSGFQLALVYRYVIDGKPVERFWSFISPKENNSQYLSSCIISELNKQDIDKDPKKLICQTYDGASLMAGPSSGSVQALVKERFSSAEYIHCYAHQMDLVISKATSVNRNVRIFFSTLQGICSFFSTSTQRSAIFNVIIGENSVHPSNTIWNFNCRSVTTVFIFQEEIIACMDKILQNDSIMNENTICQAAGYKQVLKSDSFNFWLAFFNKIVPSVDILFGQLQINDIDPLMAKKCIENFEQNIKEIKDTIFNEEGTNNTSSLLKKKRKHECLAEWECEAKQMCDIIIRGVKERFTFCYHLVASSLFSPELFPHYAIIFPEEKLKYVCSYYTFLNKTKLTNELKSLYDVKGFQYMSGTICLLEFLFKNNLVKTLSECTTLLKIILTIPMVPLQAEICNSTLKRIKTFLSNSMSEERLTALAMLAIEKDFIMSNIPEFNERVIEKFAALEEKRLNFIYK